MRVTAPGRVNLIGDHTDYTGGLVFPMAIDRYTNLDYERTGTQVSLQSDDVAGTVSFDVRDAFDSAMEPSWGRYVAAVAAQMDSPAGITGRVATTIPVGAGLSSSAALELAVARAMGSTAPPTELALLAQRAEQLATGVPTGIMDQLCIASAREGHGTLIDCHTLEVTHVPIPADISIVVRFIAHRTLVGSEYGERVAQCQAAEKIIGPLRLASMQALDAIENEVVRHRAHHVISENQRVRDFSAALSTGDYVGAGAIMIDGHHSLSTRFHTSTSQMDEAVREMNAVPGVYGARMTGGGFGGCIVALCTPTSELDGWRVAPSGPPTTA
jgi:galactokinase